MTNYTKRLTKRLARGEAEWTPFVHAPSGNPLGEGTTVINSLYQVSIHEHEGGWTWLAIVRLDREAIHDWRHLQRIKNEICGPEREAIELYPAESRLVDASNQFHLWVMPPGSVLPIGYTERDVSDQPVGAHKQRPFSVKPHDLNAADRDRERADVLFPTIVPKGGDDADEG